jgi:hypothetical protein
MIALCSSLPAEDNGLFVLVSVLIFVSFIVLVGAWFANKTAERQAAFFKALDETGTDQVTIDGKTWVKKPIVRPTHVWVPLKTNK